MNLIPRPGPVSDKRRDLFYKITLEESNIHNVRQWILILGRSGSYLRVVHSIGFGGDVVWSSGGSGMDVQTEFVLVSEMKYLF